MKEKHMNDYDTIQKKRNLVVGLFIIIGLFAFGWLVFKFKDLPALITRINSFEIFVQLPSASGVQKDTPVQFCGYQIGRVTHVESPKIINEITSSKTPRRYYQIKVTLSIDQQYQSIPITSRVKLMARGLGSSFIEITAPYPNSSDENTEFFKQGSCVQGSTGTVNNFLPEQTLQKLEQLVDTLRIFVNNANEIVADKQNKNNVKSILANSAETIKTLNNTLIHAQNIIKQGSDTLAQYKILAHTGNTTLSHADQQIEKLTKAMINTSEELTKVGSQMRIMLGNINSGKGTIGSLIQDGRFYENMLITTEQLNVLIKQLTEVFNAISEKGLSRVWKKGTK